MLNVVIIEDEEPARRKLTRFLADLDEPVSVVAELSTVAGAIHFLKTADHIDLILSDIELQDGNAFDIYNEVSMSCPIIFTTAYNQFLMDAFESNGIEYLLKPFSFERFKKAWNKFLLLKNNAPGENILLSKITEFIGRHPMQDKRFKKRLAVTNHKGTYFLEVDKILYFEALEGVILAVDPKDQKHLLTQATLKEIETILDPLQFFRINRSELVNKKYIERLERYTKNSVAIKIQGFSKHLITSQSATASFRDWLEQ